MAHRGLITLHLGTKSRIDFKPGCKFKFVHCLETYLKKLMILGHEGTLQAPFYQGSHEISLAGSILGPLGCPCMTVQEGPLSPGRAPQ